MFCVPKLRYLTYCPYLLPRLIDCIKSN